MLKTTKSETKKKDVHTISAQTWSAISASLPRKCCPFSYFSCSSSGICAQPTSAEHPGMKQNVHEDKSRACGAHLSAQCQPSEQEDKGECGNDPLLVGAVRARQAGSCIKVRRHLQDKPQWERNSAQ